MTNTLTTEALRSAVAGTAAAFRCLTRYQPVGGPGDKVFPPTYEGGRYAVEKERRPAARAESGGCPIKSMPSPLYISYVNL